jgi:hypothetical protein
MKDLAYGEPGVDGLTNDMLLFTADTMGMCKKMYE